MTTSAASLTAHSSLSSLTSVDARSLDDAALLTHVREVEALGRVVDALRVSAAAEVAERSRHELGADGLARRMGHSRASHLLETLTGSSARDVGARLSLAALVAPRTSAAGVPLPALYPAVAASLASGRIGVESARAIARTLEQAYSCDPAALAHAESVLVGEALEHSTDLVAAQARIWREALDPDGAEPRHEVLHARRALRFGREVNGMARLTVDATGADLAELRATFSAYASPRVMPRFRSADDVDPADPMRETRSREQRDFDVFMGLVRAGARSDTTRPGPRASISVTVRESDLRDARGVAWLDGVDEPVPASVVHELHCGGDRREVVVSADGEVLALGRRERLFSDAQHVALAVRDGGCIWPHCTAPPSWCDAHHVEHWQNGGPTDVANGALLCPAHHRLLHWSDFALRMRDGVPFLRAPARLDPTGEWRRVGGSRVLTVVARM